METSALISCLLLTVTSVEAQKGNNNNNNNIFLILSCSKCQASRKQLLMPPHLLFCLYKTKSEGLDDILIGHSVY